MAALLVFAGCKKDKEMEGTTLKASIEQHESDDDKTSLNPTDGAISWMAGDKITVYNGTVTATFRLTSGEGSTNGTFTYNGDFDINDNTMALYPETGVLTDNTVTFTVPQQQNVTEPGTFANGANPMLGLKSGDGFMFGSICGCLGLKLTGNNVDITAIEIVSANETLAGTVTGYFNNSGSETTNGTNSVRLNCTTTLTAEEKEFFIVLLPGTLGNGFTMNIYNGDEIIFTKTTTSNLIMLPNKVKIMNTLNVEATPAGSVIDLSTLTDNYEAQDGDILTGTLSQHYNISVAEGASVTLWNASINPGHSYKSPHGACIRCDNDATIVIEGENDMYVWTEQMPCIYIASGKTLTITGNGSLNASSTGMITAAIGGCYSSGNSCGNIVIESGNITATAGSCAAIGAGFNGNCGNITINGGTITATSTAATAIGCGNQMCFTCGDITINGGTVTATGSRAGIGGGYQSNCGDITITGGTIIATGISGSGIGAGNGKSGTWGYCGNITISGGNVTASSSGGVGIGGGCMANCGDILISGGTVTATGGNDYVAIGGSTNHTCGSITITEGVTSVTATKGANAPRCIGIGKGDYAICGTVTIGGTVYPDGATPNQADGLTFVYPVQETTITWNSSFINSVNIMSWGHDSGVSTSNGGITATFTENAGLSSSGITIGNSSAYGITFSTTTGNISKIEIYGTDNSAAGLPSGWDYDDETHKVTWQGTSAPSVTMNGVNAGPGEDVHIDYISQIVFTVQ